jgi:DNA-binding transcriptional LysR family regulator
VTAAAISARVKQLEQYLGVALFIRQRGNLALTSEGERLLPHAETLLLNWSRTLQEIALQPEQTTRLHIGATSGLWQYAVHEKLTDITAALPTLAVRAEAHDVDDLVRMVMDRTLDLIVLYEPPTSPELKSERIGQLTLVMTSSIDRVTPSAALKSGYVYVDWGTSFAMFHANKFGEIPPAILYVNLASIAHNYIKENPGSAYLPSSLVQASAGLHRVRNAPSFRRPIYVGYRANHEHPELIKKITGLIQGIKI